MRFVLAGSSGFLGQALRERLARERHEVVRLVRGEPASQSESHWDPYQSVVDRQVIEDADVVVNLAGTALAGWPRSPSYRTKLRDSRVVTTRTLAEAIAESSRKPVFLAQNGSSFYGDRGDEVLTEESGPGKGSLLTEVTKVWQDATRPAREAGARVCIMRCAPVLHRGGGVFQIMSLAFRAGLGGPVGSGRQYFPTISLSDWARAVVFLAADPDSAGVYNLVGPNTTTNAEFTRELARMVHRPSFLRVPTAPVRLLLADLAPEVLGSARVEPARLLDEGFEFEHPTLNARLAAALTA